MNLSMRIHTYDNISLIQLTFISLTNITPFLMNASLLDLCSLRKSSWGIRKSAAIYYFGLFVKMDTNVRCTLNDRGRSSLIRRLNNSIDLSELQIEWFNYKGNNIHFSLEDPPPVHDSFPSHFIPWTQNWTQRAGSIVWLQRTIYYFIPQFSFHCSINE